MSDCALADRVSRIEEREKARDVALMLQASVHEKQLALRSTWIALAVSIPPSLLALFALLKASK